MAVLSAGARLLGGTSSFGPCLCRAGANQLGPKARQHGKQRRLQQAAQQGHVPDLPEKRGQLSRA